MIAAEAAQSIRARTAVLSRGLRGAILFQLFFEEEEVEVGEREREEEEDAIPFPCVFFMVFRVVDCEFDDSELGFRVSSSCFVQAKRPKRS